MNMSCFTGHRTEHVTWLWVTVTAICKDTNLGLSYHLVTCQKFFCLIGCSCCHVYSFPHWRSWTFSFLFVISVQVLVVLKAWKGGNFSSSSSGAVCDPFASTSGKSKTAVILAFKPFILAGMKSASSGVGILLMDLMKQSLLSMLFEWRRACSH